MLILFPAPLGESVYARCLSALKDERVAASKVLRGPDNPPKVPNKQEFLENIRQVRKSDRSCYGER